MTDVADELAILKLIARYGQLIDDGRHGDVAELFAESGTFSLGTEQEHRGRDAIRALLEGVQAPERRGQHMCDGHGGWTVSRVGRYLDELTRSGEGWSFLARRVELLDPSGSR